jgi:predicted acylesterase/phospholipase RssA
MGERKTAERKTALVLSAGGMFGAYQAGAWRAIAEQFEPDIVVGASVGALNGWSIAAGCSPEHLIEKWRDPEAGGVLKLYPDAGWRNGWFDPEPLRTRAESLVADYQPRTPFGLVVVKMPWLRTELVRYPDVTAAHLQATCSIPLFLPTVRIGGSRYLDGGLLEKLPIWAAVEMGATRIIAIDSLPKVGRWWLRAGTDFARLFKPAHRLPEDLEILVISPSERMGDANDAVFWKRENIDRWVELGARDTRAALGLRQTDRLLLNHRC